MELLSPVGNFECLTAAINAGCDAVYLSGIKFGARNYATNFNDEEIKKAIEYCHLYGVKVYIAVNTLIYEKEVQDFLNYIEFIYNNNVDAVIMQDIGMIDLVRKVFPLLEIHASTQMHIHNKEGVLLCEKLGIKRVVLARETPIKLVNEIKKSTKVELEVFVHGALCMCYSGQCLMSALIGNRSGNRGTCAQICRQPYDLIINDKCVLEKNYLLSTKDLNSLQYIGQLIDIGVDSFKIEGRMKSPEYVYLITSIYRKAIDNYLLCGDIKISNNDIINMKKLFNREFTKGFLFNEDNDFFTNTFRPNHLGICIGEVISYKNGFAKIKLNDELSINDGIRIINDKDNGNIVTAIYKNGLRVDKAFKKDIVDIKIKCRVNIKDKVLKTLDYNLIKSIKQLIQINKKIKITGKFVAKIGQPLKLIVSDSKNVIELMSEYIVQKSEKNITTVEILKNQLNKLGDTIYEFESLIIDNDILIYIPIKEINKLRREVMNSLNNKRIYKNKIYKQKYDINVKNYNKENKKSILIHTYEEYLKIKNNYDTIYIDSKKEFSLIKEKRIILKLERVNEYLSLEGGPLLIGELGGVYKYKNIQTDFSLNVVNSYSVALLHSLGVNKITLSYELSYIQIKEIIKSYHNRYKKHPNLEVIISSYPEVMVCKYNILKKYNTNIAYLRDRFKNNYKIIISNNLMHIYNYKKLDLTDDYFEIGINSVRINK